MNRFYRLVWNDARSAWVPVAEISCGRRKRGGRASTVLTMLLATLGLSVATAYADGPAGIAPAVHELPTGGNVVAGSATINTTSTADTAILNVNQSSQRAVIDWNTFNVGGAAEVNFNQPNANAATLNRVLDSNASQIFGKINATGQVFLINPNGVYFGKSAQVDVGALTATTGSISNDDFMSGKLHFTRNGATGSVVNEGELRAAVGGYIALLAPEVRNSGVIVARLGTVALAAGDVFTLNFDDNHLTGITIQPATMKALVENKGAVIAPGGLIVMSAQAFDKLQGGVVNNSGTVEATGMAMKNGRIVLEASSSVTNSGTISANAGSDGSPAGSVTINAPAIENSGRIEAVGLPEVTTTGGNIALNADVITQSAAGVLDTSGFTGGQVELNATQDITLAGAVTVAATSNDAVVDSNSHGGNIAITAAHNITLQDAVIDASGDAGGGQILIKGGSTDPNNSSDHPTLALLGETKLRASSRRGRGGNVTLTSDRVGLFGDTSIDASGAAGGGHVSVGGGFHGEDASIANASQVVFGDNASIDAGATENGDGGKVAVWSDDQTIYAGKIAARGGNESGNGGFVEVSGKGRLDFNGSVNTLAAHGQVGTLLLDPYNLTISSGSDNNVTGTFDASGTGSVLNVTTLQNALANNDVTVTTGSSGAEAGNLTVASTVGWFSDYSLTLSAAGNITVNNGVSVIAAGNGNITLTTTAGDIINNGALRTYGGNLTATTLAGSGGAIWGSGSYNVAGTASFTTAGNIGLANVANKFGGDVSLLAGGSVTFVNSQATVLKGATADINGISITSGGSITTGASPTGITTAGTLSMTTSSGTNGSITYTGPVSASGNITLSADGNGAISLADINGAATFASVVAGGAVTLGDNNTGALTFDSASGNVFSGTAGSSGQASGAVTITGSSITINDPFVTKGGNLNLISTSGAVTANTGANITTTANTDTGTASGTVTVTAANGITLQNIVTTGANNSLGVGSNAAAVTLTATTGNVNVGAVTTSGGSATAGATSNRNGGNAGNIVITSTTGTTYLNGDLNAIGGGYVGTATQGLGGYIDMESAVVLTANRSVSSGATSGDILFNSTVDSDGTARSLSVTAGIGSVIFNKAVGGSSPLSSLTVASSTTTSARGNITTNAAGGVAITGTTIRLGDDTVTNGTGAITINTATGNGIVSLSSINTFLDDAVTFTRGTGAINFTNYLYSNATERNNLTFNGASGGAVTVGIDVGGTSSGATTALGDILVSTGTDLTFSRGIVAKSLVSLNNTGRLSLGSNAYGSYFDGASGFQIGTAGTANNYAGDENISIINSVTLSNASAPLSITAPGTISSSYAYNTLTTAGGTLTLTAGGSLTLPSNGSLASSGGTISLTGVGVTQAQDDTVNAGSGKIRVDGGNAAVNLNGTLITTNADTGGSPAVLVTRASTVSLRSVTAQSGTLQVGLVGSTNSLATTQTLGGSGSLTLTGNTSYYSPRRITLTGTGNNSSVSFTITGTDASGGPVSQTISGANNGTATTTQYFATVTSITTNAATVGNVTAGVANESTSGSLTQYLPGGYTNAIDIHTLSAASNAAIALTSSSNTIDQLGSFSVGSSLDVEARGRSAGMQLTGNVAATDVVIKTGNGALVLGDYNITSTSGNVWLQGTGVTQTANSTITSAGTTQIYGNDYQNGTRGNVTMAGSIVSSSHVYIYSTLNLALPNITIGSAGSRGNLYLGDNSNNASPWATYNGIFGTISQTAGTAIKIGTLQGLQVAGYGTTDLTNANNEIRYLGYYYRGGTFSVNDADTEANGLTSTSSISDGTNNTAIRIKTNGAFNLNGQQLYGQGLTISASSISGSGNLYGHSGSGGSIVLIANGGDITLSGDTYTDGTGADLVIRSANNLQLGSRTHSGNSNLTLGANATTGTLAASQGVAGAGNLSIDGTSASSGSVTFTAGQRIAITSAGNDSGITYTVTGTDMFGKAQTEVITGANAASASGSKYFNTVTQIAASGAAAGSVSVGTVVETIAGNVTQTGYIEAPKLQGNVGGSITLTNGSNSFQQIGTLTSGGNMTLYSAVNPLTISGAASSTGGNVNISSGYNLTVSSAGSVSANGAGKSVTLTSGTTLTFGNNSDYATSIQGAISADTGGVVINSAGSFANNTTGTITTTGGVSIKTYWDTLNARNLTLGGNITAGANGIKLNSSGTINQTAGVLTTTGAVSGPDSSGGGSPGVSNPSARGAVTLNGNNQVGSLGPFYVYNTSGGAFSFNDTTGGLTLSGVIETSNGNITVTTAGGALNLATYGVYAGELASGGANVALSGQGITQASGTISATGSADGTTPRNGSSGGTITLTGYDGTSSGAINLGGTIQTANNTASAVTIRGTAALALPNISAPNGSLNVGDTSQTYYHITGAITQNASTLLDIKTLNVAGDSSAVLANTGNKIVQLGNIAVGDNAGVNYDFDVYNSTNGLSLTHDVTSGGGLRIVTTQGAGSSGALALGNFNIYAIGNVYLGALGVTQGATSSINANYAGAAGSGGDITVDGGGGTNNITLAGTVRTDGSGKSLSVINATNATLNVISATAGNVVLGTSGSPLTGSISLVPTTGVVSANTLSGYAGIVNLPIANVDSLGAFTTTGALTLKDQGGAGTAGLKLTGDVAVGAASDIESSDGVLNLDTRTIDASGGTGYDLVLKGVGVSQTTGSMIKSTTAEIYGGAGNINLFSALNDFTGQVTMNSTGSQASIQDANQLSMNSLTGKLANTTSFTAWAGTNLVLTPESLTTTTGSIDLRSLNGNLSTPGNITTGAGSVTLIAGGTGSNGNVQVNNTIATGSGSVTVQASKQANLSNSITSTSGNIDVAGDTVIHSTGSPGSPLTLQTAGAGTITVNASGTGGFVMGQYYSYQSGSGAISITSGATADLANITSTSGDVTVNAVGAVQQLAGSSIKGNALAVAATNNGAITLANANNNAAYVSLRSLNLAGNAAGSGNISYNDLNAVAVRRIQTTGNATLTAGGAITTDTVTGPGTVVANALSVKTLNDSAADIALTAAGNDVGSVTLKVRNAADTADVGVANTTGNIDYTDANGFSITGIQSGGSAELAAGGAVTQTGAILVSGLGLSGAGSFTLNNASSGVPINQVSTFASNASGAVNFSSSRALTIGTVTAAGPITGVTSNGAAVTISATSIDSSSGPIDTRSSTPATAGGAVTLTTTGTTSSGNLTVGSIDTSGSDAAASTNGNGGAAGTITLTTTGNTLSLSGVITARGGAGDGSGTTGADGLVTLTANSGAVSQTNGSGTHAVDAGKLLVSSLNASTLMDTGNTTDFVAAKITGAGQGFTYRSGGNYTVGAGNGTITGLSTQGGAIDLGSSNVAITDVETITTKGGNFSADNVGSFNSTGVTLSTLGDITYAAGAYKNGGTVSITTTTGDITTGPIVTSGDSSASAATGGSVTLNANGVLTTGTITSSGAGTSVGGAVNLTGSTVRLGGQVNSGGGTGGSSQAAGGNIVVIGPAVVYGADLVLDSGSGAGNVTFSSTVDSDNIGSIRSLTINSGTGDINLQGVLGGNVTLKNVALNSSGTSTIGAAVTASSLTTDATGTTHLNGATINTTGNQGYNDDVILGANTTLTSGGNVNFATTVKSDGTNRALVVHGSGTTIFTGAVGGSGSVAGDKLASLVSDAGGTTAINGGTIITTGTQTYGDNITLGADTTLTGSSVTTQGTVTGNTRTLGITGNAVFGDDTGDSVTGVATLAVSGTTTINTDTITSTGAQTYTGGVTLGADATLTGVGVNFVSTVKSDGTNRALTMSDSGTTTFGGAVGGDGSVAGDKLASLTTNSGGTTAINGGSVFTTGTQTYGDNVTLGADTTLAGGTVTNQGTVAGNNHSLDVTGNAVFGNDTADSITGVTTLGVSGTTLINTATITSSGAQTYSGAVTLGTDASLTGSAVNFGSTVDSDATTARSLNLFSGNAGQNFVAAVGGIHALNALRIESTGVITQGGSGSIQAAQLAIKSAGNVTLTNASNDVDVLAALLSGNASLSFVDSDGVEIGNIGSAALQIIGVSDGVGISNVSITIGGPLTQAASSPIQLHGNLAVDTSAYNAGDVTVNNSGASGTVLGNSLVAGDFTLSSTGNVTQAPGAHLQVGGNFDVNGGGTFIDSGASDNLIGGGSASVSGNQIRLYGVITVSMDVGTGDLLASAFNGTSTTTASIASANLGSGVQVVSAAGGSSISSVNSGAAITLDGTNKIGGSLSITTQGTYSNSGTATATGINQSGALNLSAASFTVQQSSANAGSVIAGAGKLDLSDTGNAFAGTVSMSAVGMDAKLAAGTNIDLGNVNAQNVTIATTYNITQAATRAVQANTLLVSNAHNVTLDNANLVNTLAASGVTGALSFNNAQALSVGTASTVDGINSSGSVLLKTTAGDLVLDKSITVSGSSDITLASAANFTNNMGASALTLGTGHWQVWSSDPSLDTLNGLTPNFKQYNATYGTSTVLGSGNGVLYTLAPQLTVALTGTVVRTYDADVDATLTQGNYNVSGTIGGDSVVLGTSGTFDNKNVNTGKTITVYPVVASASNGSVQVYGYRIASGSATISAAIGQITPATISAVTGITAANKTYDSTTAATLNSASAGFTGMFVGDQLNVATATGAFVSPNASASPITVNVTGITLGGTDAGNYTLSTTTASTTALINRYAVNLTGTRVYDGTTTVGAGSLTLGTLVNGETLSLSGSATAANKNVGTETLNVSGLTLGNGTGLASNYTFTGGTQTVNITQASLTVTTSDVTKIYNGGLSASGTAIATGGTQLFGSDTLSGGAYAFTNANAGAGNKTVTTTGVTVNDGNSGGNYTVTYVNNTTSTINKADITVSTSNVTKTYDGNLSTSGTAVVVSGTLYNNVSNAGALDNLSGGTYAFTDKNAGTGNKVVTVAGVTVNDGNSGGNYNVTYTDNTTSTINRYAVNLTGTRVYDGTTTVGAGSLTLGTLVGSETLTLSGSGTAANKNVGLETVNTSGLILGDGTNGGLASNYIFTGGTQTVNITKANISITTGDVTKTYNGALGATGTAVATGGTQLFGSDTLSGGTYAFTNANAGIGNKTVTTTGVTVNDGNSGGNYIVTYVNNTTSTINKADITVSTSNVTKTYDGNLTALGTAVVASGTLYANASNGNTLDSLAGGSFAFTDKNAGIGNKAVTTSGVTVNDGNSGGNYNITYANNTTSTINRATVTFTGTVADKEYDGGTTATLSGYVLTGLIGSETLNASASSANFIDKNAAVGKTVNIGGISLSNGSNGDLASNYVVAGAATSTATITPKLLTINAVVSDKVYDGTTNASLQSYGLAGFVGSETVGGVFTGSASFADKNVGNNKAVTITGVTLVNGANGGLATNYAVSTNANSNADITKANLNIAGVVAEDKVYDGTLTANLNTSAAQITGKFGSDDVSIGLITGTYLTKDVGTNKSIGAGTVVLSGLDSGNYNLIQPTGLSSSITPRALTVTAVGNSKVYDGTTAATVSLNDNRISGDVLNATSTNAFADKNAGNGKFVDVSNIAISGTDAHNYTVNSTAATVANITKANLNVTAVGVNKVYDATTGATVSLSSQAIGNDVVNVGYSSAAFNDKNVGQGKQVNINGVNISGADAGNYVLSGAVSTTADITPATLVVGAVGNDKIYDGNTAATVTFTDNRFSGDQLSLANDTATFADPSVGNDKAIAVSGIHVTGGIDAGNYVLANASAVTTGDITGGVNNIATEVASMTPTLTLAPISVAVPTPTAVLVDLTLPAGFGRAPGNSGAAQTTTGGSSIVAGTGGGSGVNGGAANTVVNARNASSTGNTNSTGNSSAAAGNASGGELVTVSVDRPASAKQPGMVSVSVPSDLISSGKAISFSLPPELAEAAEATNSDQVHVSLKNGNRLPSWLQYVQGTTSFTATSLPPGALPLEVLVRIGDRQWIVVITERASR